MSSSSDIEKLFEHFGGDANAYQEIGRENEARTARTRWPLLVTLDLTQPTIPEIGQRREAKPQASVNAAPSADQDSTPKDVASVTRAKAPLFTRSHRRDIPPVVVAAPQPAAPTGASRFGVLAADAESATQAAPGVPAVPVIDPVPPIPAVAVSVQPVPVAQPAPVAPAAFAQPLPAADASTGLFAAHAAVPPAIPAAAQFSSPFRTPTMPTAPIAPVAPAAPAAQAPYAAPAAPIANATPSWAQALAPAQAQAQAPSPAYAAAPARPAMTQAAPAYSAYAQPAQQTQQQPQQPASILGKLFAAQPQAASQQSAAPAASAGEGAPLQSVFDRLRGTPAQTHAPLAAAPASASRATTPGVPPSWLVNGPRRS
jgi:hypothetical protein